MATAGSNAGAPAAGTLASTISPSSTVPAVPGTPLPAGATLPNGAPVSPGSNLNVDAQGMPQSWLNQIAGVIRSENKVVSEKLENLGTRMSSVETDQKSLNERMLALETGKRARVGGTDFGGSSICSTLSGVEFIPQAIEVKVSASSRVKWSRPHVAEIAKALADKLPQELQIRVRPTAFVLDRALTNAFLVPCDTEVVREIADNWRNILECQDLPNCPAGTAFARPEISPQRRKLNATFMRAKLFVDSKLPLEATTEVQWFPNFTIALKRNGIPDALVATMDNTSSLLAWETISTQVFGLSSTTDVDKAFRLFKPPRRQ